MEDLVLSIEQCKHLQELGLDMYDAKLCWKPYDDYTFYVGQMGFYPHGSKDVPTYTLQEIIEKCPMIDNGYPMVSKNSFDSMWIAGYKPETSFKGETAIEATYNLLCWTIDKD